MSRNASTLTWVFASLLIAASTHAGDNAVKIEEWSKVDVPQLKIPLGGGKDGTTSIRAYNLDGTRMGEQLKKSRKVTDTKLEAVFTINKKGKCTDVISFRQIREQWEQLGAESGPFSGSSGDSNKRPGSDQPATVPKVDLDVKDLGTDEVSGIPGKKVQVGVTIHEDGLTVREGGGVTVKAVSVYGKSEALDAKARFEENHRELLGNALQLDAFITNLKAAFMENPQVERAMNEYRSVNVPEGSSVLAGTTEIKTYPDPRQKKPKDDSDSDTDPTDTSTRAFAKKIGGMLGGKKDADEPGSKDPKPTKLEQRILSAGPGGEELLEVPDDCMAKLEKINAG